MSSRGSKTVNKHITFKERYQDMELMSSKYAYPVSNFRLED